MQTTKERVREMLEAGTLRLCGGKGNGVIEEGTCCVMQVEAFLLGRDGAEEDDDPERPVLSMVARRYNDGMTDAERNPRMGPYTLRIAESAPETIEMKRARAYIIADSARLRAALELDCAATLYDRENNVERAQQCRESSAKLGALAAVVDEATTTPLVSALSDLRALSDLSALSDLRGLQLLLDLSDLRDLRDLRDLSALRDLRKAEVELSYQTLDRLLAVGQ